ncbi:NAD-dependent epimerase/dehydratase family protein [Streptomyces thermocarboxydus]
MSSAAGVRVVVTGATGNVGTSVVRALAEEPEVGSVRGLARRIPDWSPPKTEWAAVDVASDRFDLVREFAGADAVIHLAWAFQPTHDPATTWRSNVLGSMRVFDAVTRAEVPTLVHASSVGAYSPAPRITRWTSRGRRTAGRTRRTAGRRRIWSGPWTSWSATGPASGGTDAARVPLQARVGERAAAHLRRAVSAGAAGAPRPAAVPAGHPRPSAAGAPRTTRRRRTGWPCCPRSAGPVQPGGGADGGRGAAGRDVRHAPVRLPRAAARSAVAAAWGPAAAASPHLFDAVLRLPLMDCTRARVELGWRPTRTATQVVEEFLLGMRQGTGENTAPLHGSAVS